MGCLEKVTPLILAIDFDGKKGNHEEMRIVPPKNIHVFCWCDSNDKDIPLLKALKKHLEPLVRSGMISIWHEGEIMPGAECQHEWEAALTRADLILLLVSSDLIARDDFYNGQMQQAMKRYHEGAVQIIPIILRPVNWNWEDTRIHFLSVLPTGAKPVTQWANQDEAFVDVARYLREIVKTLLHEKQKAHWVNEGEALVVNGEYDQALQAYEQVLSLDVENVGIYRKKAKLLSLLGRYKQAWNAYEQILLRSPTSADYIGKAEICDRLGYLREAQEAYEEALQLEPENAEIHYRVGTTLLRQGYEYEEAIAAYEKALLYAPNNAQWCIEKGYALRCLRRYDEALAAYESAIELESWNAIAFINKGTVLCECKKYEAALQAYQKALFFDPTAAMAYYGRAIALEKLHQPYEARQARIQAELLGGGQLLHETLKPKPRLPPPLDLCMAVICRSGGEKNPPVAYCAHNHKNPYGSVWCEQCEESIVEIR